MTAAPLGPVASTGLATVLVTTGGVVSTTLTVKVPLAVLALVSVAVQVTVVSPMGNVAPEMGVHATVAASSGSVALAA